MKIKPLIILLACAIPAVAAPIPVSGPLVYTENFDSLGAASVAWTDDSTIPGWYAQINNGTTPTGSAQASDGSGTVLSGLLNLGAAAATERALGSKATGTGGFANIAYGAVFHNTGTTPLKITKLVYTGECWRTNSTASPGVAEVYSTFYGVSATAITNIISGTGAAAAAAGAGFTAFGTGANWASPVLLPAASAVNGNAVANRTTVTFNLTTPIEVPVNNFVTIKWTDTNLGGTDGYQGIDDVAITFEPLTGTLAAALAPGSVTRSDGGTPADPTDDTFGFTANLTTTGTVGTGWTSANTQPPASNPASGSYTAGAASVALSGFPISAAKTVNFVDDSNATITAALTVPVPGPFIIGQNKVSAPQSAIHTAVTPAPDATWVINEAAGTLLMHQTGGTTAKLVTSEVVDLTGISGEVEFKANLEVRDTSSGFEGTDTFLATLELTDDAVPPVVTTVNLITPYDTIVPPAVAGDGILSGTELAAGGGTAAIPTVKNLTLSTTIPDNIVSAKLVISGNTDSANEFMTVSGIQLRTPGADIDAQAGATTFNNQNTSDPSDDTFTAPVTITAINPGTSTGWVSTVTPASGQYADAQPVTFGPFLVSAAPQSITITDAVTATATKTITVRPPARTFTSTAPANIIRLANGAGTGDDSVVFETTVAGTNGGTGWTASTATAGVTLQLASGTFGTVNIAIAPTDTVAGLPAGPVAVVIADNSYPASTVTLSVVLPSAPYEMAYKNLVADGGIKDVTSAYGVTAGALWVFDKPLRTLTMSAGTAVENTVETEAINLTNAGAVKFTAKMQAVETSTGSNYEVGDKFKAELTYTVAGTPTTINLITTWDVGNGAAGSNTATVTTAGPNGPADGYLNGYTGLANSTDAADSTAYATAAEDYNAHKARDEFNFKQENASVPIDNTFNLTADIPADADTASFKIFGLGASGTEKFVVSDILFTETTSSADTDSDGIADDYETANGLTVGVNDAAGDLDQDGQSNISEFLAGTGANNPNSVLKITSTSPTLTGAQMTISWTGVSGKRYQVQGTTAADGISGWIDLGGVVTGSSATVTIPGAPADKNYFLRVKVVP